MLENLFTTKMSTNAKKLQNRFSKIRSKNGRFSKLMAMIMSVILGLTMLCSVMVMAVFDGFDKYNIRVYYNNEIMEFSGKPFFYENSVYLPLREITAKVSPDSKILWDNGKITIYIDGDEDYYEIQIGSNQIKVDAVNPQINAMGINEERNAAVLMNDTTYVPYEIINFIYNRKGLFKDIYYTFGNIVSNEPYMDNAEYKDYESIQYLQFNVDNGHSSWRTDEKLVIEAFLGGKKGMEKGQIISIESSLAECRAVYTVGDLVYNIELFKPAKEGKDGIWIVKDFYNTNPPYTKEEIADAEQVVRKYFDAIEKRDKAAVISTLGPEFYTESTAFWHEERITLNSLEYDRTDNTKNMCMNWYEAIGKRISPHNVIVFTADFSVDIYGESPYTDDSRYTGYTFVLFRDGKDSEWKINTMGYNTWEVR